MTHGPLQDGQTTTSYGRIVREAVRRKELKHHVGEDGFRRPARTMSAIGG